MTARVDPRMALLLSCAIRFELVERDEMTLDEALDDAFIEQFRAITEINCRCERARSSGAALSPPTI